ncbi:MAG TPA: hypothetical protein VFN82_09120, partial [Solirubrobacterales bacterium]|nr:hypothetical protein [Solirubrobacterales bacterium]
HLVALLDQVLDVPLAVDPLHREGRVAPDRLRALVRPQPCVVVDRVLGEVRRNRVRVAAVQRLVVRPDVIDVAQIP